MHTIELLKEGIRAVQSLGYRVRQDWLDGQGGGACVLKGEKFLFLDIADSYTEQLEEVLVILRQEENATTLELAKELETLVKQGRAA